MKNRGTEGGGWSKELYEEAGGELTEVAQSLPYWYRFEAEILWDVFPRVKFVTCQYKAN